MGNVYHHRHHYDCFTAGTRTPYGVLIPLLRPFHLAATCFAFFPPGSSFYDQFRRFNHQNGRFIPLSRRGPTPSCPCPSPPSHPLVQLPCLGGVPGCIFFCQERPLDQPGSWIRKLATKDEGKGDRVNERWVVLTNIAFVHSSHFKVRPKAWYVHARGVRRTAHSQVPAACAEYSVHTLLYIVLLCTVGAYHISSRCVCEQQAGTYSLDPGKKTDSLPYCIIASLGVQQ